MTRNHVFLDLIIVKNYEMKKSKYDYGRCKVIFTEERFLNNFRHYFDQNQI